MEASLDLPFLVVGAGPVGLTAALLLAQAGRPCLVVDQRDGPQRHPAAHAVNARTLEIFRQAGLDMDAILAVANDPADAGHVNFLTRLDGELIGRLPYERQGDECLELTPTPLRNISQHRLEPILADAVRAAAPTELRYRTRWESSEQDAQGVTSTLRDLDTGAAIVVRSRWVLAADGAASGLRRAAGIEMVGPRRLQSFIAIHLAADLRPVVAGRPGVLHFVMDPEVGGAFIAHDPAHEWVYMVEFDPDHESVDDYDPARCRQLVSDAIGEHPAEVEVLGVGSWHMSAQVAERMRHGRVFLVGDAAHRFPPTGGLGLNSGVADVHGLVWKLGAVEDGWAGPALLDTYELERRPVVEHNCAQSTANALTIVDLLEALGIVESPTSAAMWDALTDPARRPAIDAAVAAQATHFDLVGLQLGYRYAAGAVADDGHEPTPPPDPSTFDPHAEVGARLPHAWTDDGRSTLDLVGPGGLTLLSIGGHDAWAIAVAGVAADRGVPLRHVALGVDAVVGDEWRIRCRLDGDGALLVRPDQHVAWRAHGVADVDRLGDAVVQVLGPSCPAPVVVGHHLTLEDNP